MPVTRDNVLEIAVLARLDLSPGEIERFTQQLDAILEHVAELQRVPAAATAETERTGDQTRLRDDAPPADALQRPPAAFAPGFLDGFFTVPRLAGLDADADGGADA